MKTGIYFCRCGTNITATISELAVAEAVAQLPAPTYFHAVSFICSEEGKRELEESLLAERPERVIVAACSPREHENTFRRCLENAGINPYLLQLVNIREQIAWVTDDPEQATGKAITAIKGAYRRVQLQEPLTKQQLESCADVLVIGAGPAGMAAAQSLAEAGRNVTLIEQHPFIGGLPVRFEELFPAMECAPCVLEPAMAELLHGEAAQRIELATMAQLVGVTGYFGNFTVTVHQRPRRVSVPDCIGCAECVAVCPAACGNGFNGPSAERKAIDFAFTGQLPNVPDVDAGVCLQFRGEECRACRDACPMGEDVIDMTDAGSTFERRVGAIILATGAGTYGLAPLFGPELADHPDLLDALRFERLLSSSGPTGGSLLTSRGTVPTSIAIIHCAGSLDSNHLPYCSGICCQTAFKFNRQISHKHPETVIIHYHRELVAPGTSSPMLLGQVRNDPNSTFLRYEALDGLALAPETGGGISITCAGETRRYDQVVAVTAIVPAPGTDGLARLLETPRTTGGFYSPMHGRVDPCRSAVKGVYLAGACQEPMDVRAAVTGGMAAAGMVLTDLQPGRMIDIDPATAEVLDGRCSGCRICASVCPYRAISYNDSGRAVINAVLCHGCGTCVAACPAEAIAGHHFTSAQILAEIDGVLS